MDPTPTFKQPHPCTTQSIHFILYFIFFIFYFIYTFYFLFHLVLIFIYLFTTRIPASHDTATCRGCPGVSEQRHHSHPTPGTLIAPRNTYLQPILFNLSLLVSIILRHFAATLHPSFQGPTVGHRDHSCFRSALLFELHWATCSTGVVGEDPSGGAAAGGGAEASGPATPEPRACQGGRYDGRVTRQNPTREQERHKAAALPASLTFVNKQLPSNSRFQKEK